MPDPLLATVLLDPAGCSAPLRDLVGGRTAVLVYLRHFG
jgi:hypothetical protein